MPMNHALRQLGFSATDRAVVINADDVGFCLSTVPALLDLFEVGGVSSGSVMVPCSAFAEAAAMSRAHPAVDVGVHLTLTCEAQNHPWGPVSACRTASGAGR